MVLMSKKDMIVEAKVLHDLQLGSYEELLQSLDRAVAESDMFGDEAVLFSSYSSRVVVMNEDGEFFSARYKNRDGVVVFKGIESLDVSVISEDDVVRGGVDSFLDGSSLSDSLRSLINLRNEDADSLVDRTRHALDKLFAGGKVWRKYIEENKELIGSFSWDASYGSLKVNMRPMFGLDEGGDREDVTEALVALEGRLATVLVETNNAFQKYVEVSNVRDEGSDEVMSRFESFAGDYIDYLGDVNGFLSRAVVESHDGCVTCSSIVYDEIFKRFRELDLGGRFVRKVSAQFTQ
jgi:hypothetical protein